MGFPLTQEQRNIVTDRGGELLVSAAAGSGKTRVLVERLLDRVTKEKLDIDRFLVITYTRAAAAELRERIAQELTDRLVQTPGDRHLRRQTTLVYQAQISTIHAFCSALLRESGYLLDLDPDFRLCDEVEGKVLQEQTLEGVIDKHYEGLSPDSPFAQLVDTLGAGRDDSRLVSIVLDIFARVQSHPDPTRWLLSQRDCWALEGVEDLSDTPWGRVLLSQARIQSQGCIDLLRPLLEDIDADELLSQNYGDSLRITLAALEELAGAQTWDQVCACLPIPFPRVGSKKKRKLEVSGWEEDRAARLAGRIKALREYTKGIMKGVAEEITDGNAPLLEELRLSTPAMQALIDLVLEFQTAFSREKERRALMDFGDLEHYAVSLLLDGEGRPTDLARSWSGRYDEILVDEYQDTNQVQNAIFYALSDGGRKLVEVGDVKQSIYRFRLADPTIFLDKYSRFPDGEGAEAGAPRRRTLSRNFRSRPQVLEGCNDVFRSIMSPRLGELDYTEDQALVPGAQFPEGKDYALELDLLDLTQGGAELDENSPGRDLLEARFAARRIRELLDSGMEISEGGGLRPLRPSDVMILMRSPGSAIHQYIRALGERGIPCAAEGGEDFFETPEVYAALSILQIVDNPRQDVPLIAALRSPVYGFTADQLAMIRTREKKTDFYTALTAAAEEGDAPCARFLEELALLRSGAGDMTTGELVWHIYEKTNILGIFGAMEHGAARQENLLRLYNLAREMENSGCRTLFQFLLRLERLKEAGGKLKTTAAAPEGEGVSIMSIHRSKGLEKPMVLVCGLTKQFNKTDLRNPVLFHPTLGIGAKGLDRERRVEYNTVARRAVARALESEMLSEELRLLYVAMTRAKEKLILTLALKDGEKTVGELSEFTAPRIPPALLEQQPTAGHWLLLHALSRQEAGEVPIIARSAPEAQRYSFGPPWDIRWIKREEIERPTAPQVHIRKEDGGEELTDYLTALRWSYPTPAPTNIPSKLTATQIKGRSVDEEIVRDAPPPPTRASAVRPNFIAQTRGLTPAQRGSALHLVMEKVDLRGDLSQAGIRDTLDRLVAGAYMTPAQRDCVPVEQVADFYASELGKQVIRAKTCQREFKFSLLVDAGEYFPEAVGEQLLLQGVVDLWFEDEGGVTVVDFKSDRIAPGQEEVRAEEYRPQLQAYAKALKRVLGAQRVRTVVWFFHTARGVEL